MDATRLHSISARSSRARIRAVWARHATRASFLASPYRDSVSTSWAAASPAKSATFAGATPSSQRGGVAEFVDLVQVLGLGLEP